MIASLTHDDGTMRDASSPLVLRIGGALTLYYPPSLVEDEGALANQGACPASNGGAGDRAIETGTGSWRRIGNVGTSPCLTPDIALEQLGDLCGPGRGGLVEVLSTWAVFSMARYSQLGRGLGINGFVLSEVGYVVQVEGCLVTGVQQYTGVGFMGITTFVNLM